MKDRSYLQKLGDRWYVRVKVPRALQGRLRNTHVRRALGTADPAEANRRKWAVLAAIQREFCRLGGHHAQVTGHGGVGTSSLPDPVEPVVALPSRLERPLLTEVLRLDGLVDRWLDGADYLAQTKQQHRQAYRELRSFLGADLTPDAVTPQVALEFVEEHIKATRLAYATKRRKLNSLMAFWEWLVAQRLTPPQQNPWRGFRLGSKKAAATPQHGKRPYTDAELLTLFRAAPAYPGLGAVMALGLLTGMRLEEICALRSSDIVEDSDGGVWVDIRKAKTRAGVRRLMVIHPEGQALLLARQRAVAADDDQLFPEFKGGGYDGKLSWAVSKAFGRHRRKLGLGSGTDFHSFRRTFITLMENAQVDQVRIARYVGHELPTLAFSVYSGGSTTLTMRETARAVRYPDAVESGLRSFLGALNQSKRCLTAAK